MSLAVIVVVVDDPDLLTRLSDDLRRRFGTDYEVMAGSSEWALNGLDLLADQGRDVALVMAPAELPDVGMSGVALLTNVRARHPQARRLLLVERGRWRGHPVR